MVAVAGGPDGLRFRARSREMIELRVRQHRHELVRAGAAGEAQTRSELAVVRELVQLADAIALSLTDREERHVDGERRVSHEPNAWRRIPAVSERRVGAAHAGGERTAPIAAVEQPGDAAGPRTDRRGDFAPLLRAGGERDGAVDRGTVRPARDDVDHAAKRIRAVERGLRPLYDLDPIDQRRRHARQVEGAVDASRERLPIDQDQHTLGAEPLQLHAGARRHPGLELDAGLLSERGTDVARAGAVDVRARDDFCCDDGVTQPLLAPGRGDHDLVEGDRQRRERDDHIGPRHRDERAKPVPGAADTDRGGAHVGASQSPYASRVAACNEGAVAFDQHFRVRHGSSGGRVDHPATPLALLPGRGASSDRGQRNGDEHAARQPAEGHARGPVSARGARIAR